MAAPAATNEELAAQFDELGDRLLLDGELWFKVAAYRRAAATIRSLTEDVETIASNGRLRKLPGIGEAITSKVEVYRETGHIPALERVRAAQPAGLLSLFRETGLAPRLVRALALGPLAIASAENLREAIDSGALDALPELDARAKRVLTRWRTGLAPA
jgi:DNA polymerase (family 10)